jgi:hypothetical protein
MKRIFVFSIMFLSVLIVNAQQEQKKLIPGIKIKVNNHYDFATDPLKNYYALGGEAGIILNNNIYLGLAQFGSVYPNDIGSANTTPEKVNVYSYSMHIAYQQKVVSGLYTLLGIHYGYGSLKWEYRYNNGEDSDETMTREKIGSQFITPDIRIGIMLNKYFSIEGGVNYRYFLQDSEKWDISVKDLNGIGFSLAIVGDIPL